MQVSFSFIFLEIWCVKSKISLPVTMSFISEMIKALIPIPLEVHMGLWKELFLLGLSTNIWMNKRPKL